MNDGPAQFAPYGHHVASITLYEGEHLKVCAPSNRYLLGMKVHASRPADLADAVWLMKDTGLHRRTELHNAAHDVSRSIDKKWKPNRRQKRFVRACVRERRRTRNHQSDTTTATSTMPDAKT